MGTGHIICVELQLYSKLLELLVNITSNLFRLTTFGSAGWFLVGPS